MKKVKQIREVYFVTVLLVLFFQGCSPLISVYDQYAYIQATSLKVDLQNLVKESTVANYDDAKDNISKVDLELQKAFEYAKGRSKNGLSTSQYSILLSDTHFFKKFLNDWKVQKKESETAANEESIKIGQLMDKIIELENGKNKQTTK